MYVDYDRYASMSSLRRNNVLSKLTPENVAELVTTHWRRFLDENRGTLSSEQVQFLEETIAWIRPELYRRKPTEEDFHRDRAREAELLRLFPREDVVRLHMGAFKNSGDIANPIARALIRVRPVESDELEAALRDLASLPVEQLRQTRPELAQFMAAYFEGMPAGEEFWTQLDDEDVRLAASRARGIVHKVRNPIALILLRDPSRTGEDLATALEDLARAPIDRLREARADLPDVLSRYFDGLPAAAEFWRLAADEDVRMAASRAHVFVTQPWLRGAEPRRPGSPR